jgi:FKBP-type peptidyl-prolyl cis-trans isomerase
MDFSFKLDQRLTRGLYMGDRWVSPPVYSTLQPGDGATVEAAAQGRDATGKTRAIRPRWRPSDPAMLTVTPVEGGAVTITVRAPGESRLLVSADGILRALHVRVSRKGHALAVEIAQVPLTGNPEAHERERLLAGRKEAASYAFGVDFGRRWRDWPVEVEARALEKRLREALAVPPPEGRDLPKDHATGGGHAVAAELGGRLREVPVDLDAALVARGAADGLWGNQTLLTEPELQTALTFLRLESGAEARRRLASKNREDGEAFLAENRAREGVVTLASGLQYRVLRAGDGPKPAVGDTVVCHYRGTFTDGTPFDSTLERGRPVALAVNRGIRGFRQALPLMPVGSKWQLFVPSNLAYGPQGAAGKVGPNATLVFEVELLSIKDRPETAQHGSSTSPRAGRDPPQ